ncbi:hypothetical protein AY599_09715 [Leptolyngbya valderiana BDU 20041]|nr:hypothetical protein AY599_09715 [Leptolyngbya valderiana BDU 20041]
MVKPADTDAESWTDEELVGGHPALDFVNTAGGRTKARDRDRLIGYRALLVWAAAVGLLEAAEVAALARAADMKPAQAGALLARTKRFREALHGLLTSLTSAQAQGLTGAPAPPEPVTREIRAALAAAELAPDGSAYRWRVAAAGSGLRLPLHRLALAAQDLLSDRDLARLRSCARCSWLFLDRGRGRPRRWCSMAACGNRAKAARHYARRKRATAEPS